MLGEATRRHVFFEVTQNVFGYLIVHKVVTKQAFYVKGRVKLLIILLFLTSMSLVVQNPMFICHD
jgi:hypothetical protein